LHSSHCQTYSCNSTLYFLRLRPRRLSLYWKPHTFFPHRFHYLSFCLYPLLSQYIQPHPTDPVLSQSLLQGFLFLLNTMQSSVPFHPFLVSVCSFLHQYANRIPPPFVLLPWAVSLLQRYTAHLPVPLPMHLHLYRITQTLQPTMPKFFSLS